MASLSTGITRDQWGYRVFVRATDGHVVAGFIACAISDFNQASEDALRDGLASAMRGDDSAD